MKVMKTAFQKVSLVAALAVLTVPMFAKSNTVPRDLRDAVRHELVMLPYYSVFDNFEYKVDDGTVTLYGEVTRPVLKSDAEHAVKHIPGVVNVVSNIKVLPLSPFDNRIRAAEYRSIFGFGSLYRYAMGANPSIHIIVDNGHVTLKGVVANQGDKNIAYIRANGVPGVFSVTNDLLVEEKN
jgi:hyperosmotically inducible protein